MSLEKVEVLLFDTHLALNPLGDPSLVRPELAWLVDQGAFDELYSGTEPPPSTACFDIQRVRREKRHNLFWRAYAAATSPVSSAWQKVMPFRFVPRRELLPLESSPAIGSAEPRVRSWVLVWPFGWSSNVHLTLKGPLTIMQLRERVNLILESQAFLEGTKPVSLVEVFQKLMATLKADLYRPGKQIGDYIHKPRHQIVAVTASEPPFPRFDDPKLAQSDWARIFAVVLNRQVNPAEVPALKGKLLISKYKDGSFAVTDFDRGSFLLLSGASRLGRGERSFSCMSHNLETATLIGLIFSGFLQAAKKRQLADEGIDALVRGAQDVLTTLPTYYQNILYQELAEKHGSLKPYWTAPPA
jgi:hypothetical protein